VTGNGCSLVTRDPQAIAKIPPGYRFVEPGTLTVAISALNSPPLGAQIQRRVSVQRQGAEYKGRYRSVHDGSTLDKNIAKIPPGYRFVEPGTLTVAISALNSPPLALLASVTGNGCSLARRSSAA
jgi:hypothetical protein